MSKAYDINQKLGFTETISGSEITEIDDVLLEEVKVKIERLEEGKRRFYAEIQIPYSREQVWQVLTNYEAYPEFMNNLQQLRQMEDESGNVRLEKILTKKIMGMQFQGRMITEIEKNYPHEIRENLVEGDFQSYSSCWRLNPLSPSNENVGVHLVYDLLVWPKRIYPSPLIEYVLSKDVPKNMLAIRQRIEALFGSKK